MSVLCFSDLLQCNKGKVERAQMCAEWYEIQEARVELFVSLRETETLEATACEEKKMEGIIKIESQVLHSEAWLLYPRPRSHHWGRIVDSELFK